MNSSSADFISKLPSDLLSAEILPWLSYGQLNKVARVSKKLSNIVKNAAPFTINTFYSGWLDRERLFPHLDRCKHLTLGIADEHLLNHLASSKKLLSLETLDVSYHDEYSKSTSNTPFKALVASILRITTLKVLKVTSFIDFKYLVSENVICPSVHHLGIRNPNKEPRELISTADVLKVFPSLKRIEIHAAVRNDVEQYLVAHPECKIEHLRIAGGPNKGDDITDSDSDILDDIDEDNSSNNNKKKKNENDSIDAKITVPLKSLKLKGTDSNKDLAKYNLQHVTSLILNYGLYSGGNLLLPYLENLESLEICSQWDPKSFEVLAQTSHLQHLKLRIPTNISASTLKIFPQSLKSLDLDADFNVASIASLPNLESLRLQSNAIQFWNSTETPSFATVLKRIDLNITEDIEDWSPIMNQFINLTHVTINAADLKEIPIEFFKSCTKITHFAIEECDNMTTIPAELSLWTLLESLRIFPICHKFFRLLVALLINNRIDSKCALTSIPEGLADLSNLTELDLRDNPFTLESAPVTLPIRTVQFKDREWIQLIQRYIKDQSAAPTVAIMMKLPFLSTYRQLYDDRLARVTLHGCNKLDQLDPLDNDSDALCAAIMKSRRRHILKDCAKDLAKNPLPYLAKDQILGIILFHEYVARSSTPFGKMILVESNGVDTITTYSYTHPMRKGDRSWSSRAVWDLKGHIHEFEGLTGKEKETKQIRSIVEGK